MYENSVTYQFVANAASGLATGDPATALPEGAVGVFTEAGVSVDPAVAIALGTRIKIGARVNGTLKFSPVFNRGNARIEDLDFIAPIEQVSFIGFNGTDGALDADIDTTYTASIRLENTQGVYNNTPVVKTVPVYIPDTGLDPVTDNAELQFEHATRLIDSFAAQFSTERLAGQVIRAERVSDGIIDDTFDDLVDQGAITNFRLTNGSPVVQFLNVGGAAQATGAGAGLAVGDYVRVGGVDFQVADFAATDTSFILDRPYIGATATVAIDHATSGTIEDAAAGGDIPDNWGVRLTGVTPANFDAKTDMWPRIVRFQASYTKTFTDPILFRKVIEPADAVFTTIVAAFEGVGSSAEVAKREVYTNMNEQNHIVSHFPPTRYRDSVDMTNDYDQVVINATEASFVDVATGKMPISRFNIIIALDDNLNYDTLDDIFDL